MGVNCIEPTLQKKKKEMKRSSSYTWQKKKTPIKKKKFAVCWSDCRYREEEKKGSVGLV